MTGDDGRVTINTEWFPPRGLQALGRVVELSAKLDEVGRGVLAAALGVSTDAADALFLGDRFGILLARLKQLKNFEDLPGAAWISEAETWIGRVETLQKERNLLGAPAAGVADDGRRRANAGLGRARRGDVVEKAEGRPLLDLIAEMERA